jgi:hypothetical protein
MDNKSASDVTKIVDRAMTDISFRLRERIKTAFVQEATRRVMNGDQLKIATEALDDVLKTVIR